MSSKKELQTELEKIRNALQSQEALKDLLSDEQYNHTIAPLKERLVDLENRLTGSGAIAHGNGAIAAGAGGVAVRGNVYGNVNVHNPDVVATPAQDLRLRP